MTSLYSLYFFLLIFLNQLIKINAWDENIKESVAFYYNNKENIIKNTESFSLAHVIEHGVGKNSEIIQRLDISNVIKKNKKKNDSSYSSINFSLDNDKLFIKDQIGNLISYSFDSIIGVLFGLKKKSKEELVIYDDDCLPLSIKLTTHNVIRRRRKCDPNIPFIDEHGKKHPESCDNEPIPPYLPMSEDHFNPLKNNNSFSSFNNNDFLSNEKISVPDLSDRATILSLAKMANNAYSYANSSNDWIDVNGNWSHHSRYGWHGDGVRGHIFASDDNSTVVIAIKGTSAAVFDSGGDTSSNDKLNDNTLFSCCCARVSYLWNTVCDCYSDSYVCNQTCLETAISNPKLYYAATLDIYHNIAHLYPNSQIWLVGHSLGGALASLLGRTYGLPVVAFEAPGEALAASRLHLPLPPGLPISLTPIWHIGHTADPIFMGVCTGPGSSCWIGGYAMETECHTGHLCIYDVVKDKGWRLSMLNHRIRTVIDNVITEYNVTPPCFAQPECQDCFNWDFIDGSEKPGKRPKKSNPPKNSLPIPSLTSSISSSLISSSLSSNTISTSTNPTHSSSSTVSSIPNSTTSSNPSSTTNKEIVSSTNKSNEISIPTTSNPNLSKTKSHTSSMPSSSETPKCPPKCLKRAWYGGCLKWADDNWCHKHDVNDNNNDNNDSSKGIYINYIR